jgi:VCBS repeat-containing protein
LSPKSGGNIVATINGTSGDDHINGTNGDDVIYAGAGNDTVNTKKGNDTVYGGDGNDEVRGDSGNDTFYGEGGNDALYGNSGNDTLVGGAGYDYLDGGDGVDTARYYGSIFDYSFYRSGGALGIVDSVAARDGADLLVNIEKLIFADATIDLTANNAPIARDDAVTVSEDVGTYSSGSAKVTDNDFDFEGDSLTVTPGTFTGTYGTLVLNANGSYTYTPFASTQSLAQGQSVQDSFNYTVSDGSLTDTGALVITINGANDAPVANPDAASGTENQVLSIAVLANDTDVDNGAVLSLVSASGPAGKGSVSTSGNNVVFNPGTAFDHLAAGATETVVLSYTMQDEHGAQSSSTVTVTVTGTNDAPVAHADTASTSENATISIAVLANDTDVDDGAVLSLLSASAPAGQGSAGTSGNNVVFNPGSDFDHLAEGATATVVLAYTMQDEHGAMSSSTVTVTVTGTNDGPVAHADAASTTENAAIGIAVLANDTDVDDGAVLSLVSASAPAGQGSASVSGNNVVFNPGADFDHLAEGATATILLTYTMQDEHGAQSSSTVSVTVTGTNDAPVAHADATSTSENATVSIAVLANDTDVDDGAVLSLVSASAPAGQGSASVSGNNVVFNPGADFDHLAEGATATVTLTYTMQDEHGAQSSSTVTVTVTGTNDAPVAHADAASTTENAAISIAVLANDTDVDDGAMLSLVSASAPAGQGSASVSGNNVVFNPGTDFDHLADGATASVVLSYTMQDEHGAQSSSTVTVTVTGTNDAPVAHADTATTSENAAVAIDVLANDTDVDDGHVLSLVSASAPTGQGSAAIAGGKVVFDPGSDFDHLAVGESASVTLSYTMQDEHNAQSSSTVTVTVTGTNDAPVIDEAHTTASGSVSELPNNDPQENVAVHHSDGSIAFTDADTSDTHTATATPAGAGYYGSFTLDPVNDGSGTVAWHFSVSDAAIDGLAAGQVVTQTYGVDISDGHGGTAHEDVTVTITGAADNIAPVANDDSYSAIGNVTLTVPAGTGVLANDTDDQALGGGAGQTHVSAFDATSAHGGHVSVNPDGSFSYTSAAGFSGADTFTYTLTDADGASDTATVTVSVSGHVWFIDNSAGGSNAGTEDNPYTSIAAFNSAQGTANGPHAGDTVYLRGGTGTYTEADGIHLLDGQTLVGGGEDLVVGSQTIEAAGTRPTIVVTGSEPSGAGHDGLDVAHNNHVSGLDIGSVTRAGISDSNGSVGTLTVSDVGKSGAGQVVDIDQGGSLNVTLTSAASTGSAGGAIDLEGVSGSFTVAGALAITGSQSGGGVHVSSSMATVALNGGGTISTGATDAIDLLGNGGSLSIGGGLAIVTAGGIGLNASGGGTVTATGSGNSIVAAGGATLSLVNTTIGAAGLVFQSISATGGTNAIVLQHTGALGGLTVAGTGIAGSGGTVSGTSGAGIVALDTQDMHLASMVFTGTGTEAISATNLRGANSVMGSTISGFGANGGNTANAITIANTNTDLGSFTLANSTISNGATGNNGLAVQALGSSNMTIRVDNSTLSGLLGDGVRINGTAGSTGTVNVTVAGSTFSTATATGAGGVDLVALGSMTLNALVEDSIFDHVMTGVSNLGAITASNSGSAALNLSVLRDSIHDLAGGRGITVSADGGSTHLKIDHTSIDRLSSASKAAVTVNLTLAATADVIVTNNQIGQSSNLWTTASGSANAVLLQTSNTASMNALIDGNAISGNTSNELVRLRAINSSTLGATVSHNALTDTFTTHLEFDASTATTTPGGGTINLDMFANTLPAAGVGRIRLGEGPSPSDINVHQADSASLATANSGATIVITGSPDFGQPSPTAPTAPTLPPGPMMASAVATSFVGHLLTQGELDGAVQTAIDDWIAAGASPDQVAAMRGASFSIADLGGLDLGLADGSSIAIDLDGAGYGWASGTGSGMDLLTVVLHELGHAAGFADSYSPADAGDVMYAFLGAGEHRVPVDIPHPPADPIIPPQFPG